MIMATITGMSTATVMGTGTGTGRGTRITTTVRAATITARWTPATGATGSA